jgi:hypothetical protein
VAAHIEAFTPDLRRAGDGRSTPEQVLKSIVDGINTGNLDTLMALYEPGAAFATQPGDLSHGLPGVRQALAGFVAMKGALDNWTRRPTSETGRTIGGCAPASGRRLLALRD